MRKFELPSGREMEIKVDPVYKDELEKFIIGLRLQKEDVAVSAIKLVNYENDFVEDFVGSDNWEDVIYDNLTNCWWPEGTQFVEDSVLERLFDVDDLMSNYLDSESGSLLEFIHALDPNADEERAARESYARGKDLMEVIQRRW